MSDNYIMKNCKEMDFGDLVELAKDEAHFKGKQYDEPITNMDVLIQNIKLGEAVCLKCKDVEGFENNKKT
eukprot:12210176-Heterocapsa_arctica.AAC.1